MKSLEESKCSDEIKYLREDNQSKNEIIKILSENINKLSGDRKVLENKHEVDCDNSDFRVIKSTRRRPNIPIAPGNVFDNIVSPNKFEPLSLINQSGFKETFEPDLPIDDKYSNSQRPPKSNLRPSICTTENHLRNFTPRKRIVPGYQNYSSVVQEKEKVFIVGDSHLIRINKRKFKEDFGSFVSFKCFGGANTKELDHHLIPTLVDHKPMVMVVHIGSNDITKQNYKKVYAEDIARRIIGIGLKCRFYGVQKIAISSILGRNIIYVMSLEFQMTIQIIIWIDKKI